MSDISEKYRNLFSEIRRNFPGDEFVPLHAPVFRGNEKKYVLDCIDSTYVSSVGAYVGRLEQMMCDITGAKYAVATMNGTAALHLALVVAGVKDDEEVITQPLTFAATCNAISYQRAHPVFIDVDLKTLGMSPSSLRAFLVHAGEMRNGICFNRLSGRRIGAILPMHTFGFNSNIEEIVRIGEEYSIPVIEDAAEAMGSYASNKHLGTFGTVGAFSFNGNKIVTSGGGGCIVTDSKEIAELAKHLSTTAKRAHAWEFYHDQVGYNYRMPNINAALLCAQLEQLDGFVSAKRALAESYAHVCRENSISFITEPVGCKSNYWLNAILVDDSGERDDIIRAAADVDLMLRPIWQLMTRLPAFESSYSEPIPNAIWLQDHVLNLPSSVPPVAN